MTNAVSIAIGAALVAAPLANPEVLEESVANEVQHAIDRAPAVKKMPIAADSAGESLLGITNGMSATDVALHLVSTQKTDGRWIVGTNDLTDVAVRLLRRVSQ